jgi:hypothetical protein
MSNKSQNANTSFCFRTPAGIVDFPNDEAKQDALNALWCHNLDGFTRQGMQSNPWNSTNTPPTTNYYNPVDNNPPAILAPVIWSAFPGRIHYNFPSLDQDTLNQLADTGQMPNTISNNPCGTSTGNIPYYPYGPRGWQDEYCEWAVTKDTGGNIIRIDFTCENPEYWNSLWLTDPDMVLTLYRSILGKPQITLADLSIPGISDPITGRPIYNPLNKWNSGTVSDAQQGGAIHLTSTPNTLQTEIGLATAATVLRINPNGPPGSTNWPSSQYNSLLCDAQYGQKYRNSDPNIGGNVNTFVNSSNVVTLADPPGLYIQMPDFSSYSTPDQSDPSQYWRIIRGSQNLTTQDGTPMPGNFILHAVFEVPASKGFTVSQIKIGGKNITWGSQVAATFKMQIVASAYQGTKPQGYNAVGTPPAAQTFAQPLQLFNQAVFDAMYQTSVPNPVNNPIPLLSNSTFIPPTVFQGAGPIKMVLTVATCNAIAGQPSTYPTVSFDDANITANVTNVVNNVTYAVPGNSMPSTNTALYLDVYVGSQATPGSQGVFVTNPGQAKSLSMPALLSVLPVTIQANIKWQNTGVMIAAGSNKKVQYASGLWTANPEDNGGALYNAAGNPTFIPAKSGYTMPGQNEGALIGRIGSTVFLVGMGVTIPSNLSGPLELCINDDLNGQYGAGFTDNIGAITVTIS